jgi:hypothetical protein
LSFKTRQNVGLFVPAMGVGVKMGSSLNSGREGLVEHVSRVIKKKKVASGLRIQSKGLGIESPGTLRRITPNSG